VEFSANKLTDSRSEVKSLWQVNASNSILNLISQLILNLIFDSTVGRLVLACSS